MQRKTHQCSQPDPATPQLKGPGLWGSHNSTWPSPRTQSPHGLYPKRDLEPDTVTPMRSLETGPCFHPHPGPYPDHLRVPKARFILQDNTSIFPSLPPHWPLPECVSAGPAFNTLSLQKSLRLYPKGLLLQPPFPHYLRCPEHRGLGIPHPTPSRQNPAPSRQNAQLQSALPSSWGSQEFTPNSHDLPPQLCFHPSLLPTAQQIMPHFIWKTLK